jgi:hypothetical protein
MKASFSKNVPYVITKWPWCKCVWLISPSKKLVAKNPYNSGDLIGRQGVEESYEDLYAELKESNTFKR